MADKSGGQQTQGPDAEGGVVGLLEQLSQEQNENTDGTGDGEGGDGADPAGDGAEGQGEGEPGVTTDPPIDTDAIVAQIEAKLAARFDAVADRRVNAILKEVRGNRTPAAPKGGQQVSTQPVTPTVDARAARLSFKEYLSDSGIQFLGAEERAMAMDLGASLIAVNAGKHDDEDELGREVAGQVKTKITEMRSFYEKRTVEALRQRGALSKQEGQPTKGPNKPGAASDWGKGEEIAKQMFGPK